MHFYVRKSLEMSIVLLQIFISFAKMDPSSLVCFFCSEKNKLMNVFPENEIYQ